ncbi:NAD(P)-binding protein [soil metagenome]
MMTHSTLPEHLRERLRVAGDRPPNQGGRFVLYWMHNALRGHENPALDVAIATARDLALPVFVYQGLSERYRYVSDRHHAFIMQGARDAHAELASRGVGAAFHLERQGHRGPHLRTLAARAAVVVTEELPTDPISGWNARLAETVATPFWLVYTACVVPMKLVRKAHERAFAFRDATRKHLEKRLTFPWPEQPDPSDRFLPPGLPFEPVDLATADLRVLIAACDIDHTVGPVPHTVGGSRAGYTRWEEFKANGLRRYADDRNDGLRDGVSRMSAYLHYGMVSPLRIAREAAGVRGPGAEKFLDELLVWRELAYSFCHYRTNHETLSAIPKWAIDTLRQHEEDPRPALLDWETLARGRTGDPLWDAAQKSLLIQGELHNNVRMTWGKASLNWTPDAADALRLMIDLNHRYALDGRDPASYGGLLWCLGQFDRPHNPPQQIFGTVRTRPTEEHSARLEPGRYLVRTTRPWQVSMPRVAVVGAGVSGLICARNLVDHGFRVTVFDKSRGTGGRAATRRVDPELSFDHGAQYFTARDPLFARYVTAWQAQGVVAEWGGRVVKLQGGSVTDTIPQPRYVGVPGMSALGTHLAAELAVRRETRITRVTPTDGKWNLSNESGIEVGPFEFLIMAVPAPQAVELLAPHPFAVEAAAVPMTPCWAVAVAYESRYEVPWDGAFVHDSSLSWVARNSSKPGRPVGPDCWVLHAGPEWSAVHRGDAPEAVGPDLLDALHAATGLALPVPIHLSTHRWRYCQGADPQVRTVLFDPLAGLVVCGDWLTGGRVEGAFSSGAAAAGCILRQIGIRQTISA